MKYFKIIFAFSLIFLMGFVAFGTFTHKKAEQINQESYSVPSVVKTLEVISREPHSIEHPEAREDVRQYLFSRLRVLDSTAAYLYRYDSIPSKFGGSFDIGNVYGCFNPLGKDTADAYILLVAHFDSRYAQDVRGKKVYSYGAADDGYGVATILECLENALDYRNLWSQGVKVLFTDSEEHNMDGMRCAFGRNREIFENVNLVINIEARGVKGPVLLFETSAGNSELIDFYTDFAQYPYTYSLTSVVYNLMPNYTDFTIVRDDIPGYNFSLLEDIDHYHTDKDNFSNISTNALAHYGSQIQPMVLEYLTDARYGSSDYFKAEDDAVVFTVPGLGTKSFDKGGYFLFNSIILMLCAVAFVLYLILGRISVKGVLKESAKVLAISLIFAIVGFGVSFVASKVAGVPFNIVSTKYIAGDTLISVLTIALCAISYILFYLKRRNADISGKFVYERLFSGVFVSLLLAFLLLFTIGENFFLLVPAGVALVAMILHTMIYLNNLSILAIAVIELLAVSFLYNLLTALTIGSLGVIMFLSAFYIIIMVSLFECYMIQNRKDYGRTI